MSHRRAMVTLGRNLLAMGPPGVPLFRSLPKVNLRYYRHSLRQKRRLARIQIVKDVSGVRHLGGGDYKSELRTEDDVDAAVRLLKLICKEQPAR